MPKSVSSFSPRHVAIAWKDVRETRRAVLDALPFLQQAETVMIVEILKPEATSPCARSRMSAISSDFRHGIKTIAE